MSGEREREHCKSMILISAIISMVIPTMADTIVPESIYLRLKMVIDLSMGFVK